MKFFLTSSFSKVADKLSELIDANPETITVAFIATAAEVYKDKWFVDADRNTLKAQGFKIREISLHLKNAEALAKEIADCAIIFVAGGNVFYLLQEVRKSGFDTVLNQMLSSQVVYVGSSAGSVLVGPDIEVIAELDDPLEAPELKNYKGLGLVDFIVLPHYNQAENGGMYNRITEKALALGFKTKLLQDSEYILV